jgi:hypothetical protein
LIECLFFETHALVFAVSIFFRTTLLLYISASASRRVETRLLAPMVGFEHNSPMLNDTDEMEMMELEQQEMREGGQIPINYQTEMDSDIAADQDLIKEKASQNPNWFWTKKEAIEESKRLGHECIVARDAPKGRKQFSSIPDTFCLPTLTEATPLRDRNLYECFGAGTTKTGKEIIKGYLDVEYYHPPTEYAWQHLWVLLCLLSLALMREFSEYLQGETPLFGITSGSRLVAGIGYKYSFHVCVQNLFVESPNQILKTFVTMFIAELYHLSAALHDAASHEGNTELAKLLSEVPLHEMIDPIPYASFQQMRMPLSSKSNDETVTILTGLCTHFEPLSLLPPEFKHRDIAQLCPDSDLLRAIIKARQSVTKPPQFDKNDVEGHTDLFLTLINHPEAFIMRHTVPDNSVLQTQILSAQSSQGAEPPKRKLDTLALTQRTENREGELPSDVHLFLSGLIQEPKFGLAGYKVTGKLIIHNLVGQPGSFSCTVTLQKTWGEVSKCPLQQPGEEAHRSNNQMIGIYLNGKQTHISLKCHSEHCKGRKLEMGELPPKLLKQLRCDSESDDVIQEGDCDDMAVDCEGNDGDMDDNFEQDDAKALVRDVEAEDEANDYKIDHLAHEIYDEPR